MNRKYTYAIMLLSLLALIVSAGCDSPGNAAVSVETDHDIHDGHDHEKEHLETEKHRDDPHGHTDEQHKDDVHDDHDDGDDHEHGAESDADSHDEDEAGHVDVVHLSSAELVEFGV